MVKTATVTSKLQRLGTAVVVALPERMLRSCGFISGSFVRVIVLADEIRIRQIKALRAYDLETLEEYRERVEKDEAEPNGKWD